MPSFPTTLKSLAQLGFQPLGLYALYQLGVRTGHYRRLEAASVRQGDSAGGLQPLITIPGRPELLRILGEQGRSTLQGEADEIVGGKVRLFGGEPAPVRLTFSEPLRHWTEYETGKAPIPFAGYPFHDVKFLWEPARFGWALTLGRAYHVTGDEKYAESFWLCFEEFLKANPAYLGPNWMNGQEAAIRLMALLWAAQLFERAEASSQERRARLIDSIMEHARRIPPTLVYARSQNNNHLVTESAALFAAGAALGEPHWRASGWQWLNHALQTQISSYGEYIQHSSNYHRLMLQSVLWVDAILRQRRDHWPYRTMEALMRASHWLFSMIDPISGKAPNLGANDGALILPLYSGAFDDFRPTVQAAARAFLRTSLPQGKWDELSLWLGLPPGERTADSDAYMAEHLRGRHSWGYLRASRFRSRLSHMDQLHFDLWRAGENIALDAGTYLYNGDPPWDNPLVATGVHNTITVDAQDQMQRGGRFLVLDWFPAYSKTALEADERILGRMLAYHKGYRCLGVRHERIATVFTDEHWEIRDNLVFTKPGQHVFRLHWLLKDGEWKVERRGQAFELRLELPNGPLTVRTGLDPELSDVVIGVSIVRAGELIYGSRQALPFEGWVSPTYGVRVPALSVAIEASSSRTLSFLTSFMFG